MSIKLRRLSFSLGAEVCDIDCAAPMSESDFGEIYQAFLDHCILLFRNQNITREQHLELSRRFGELDRHDAFPSDRHPQYPELMVVTNDPAPDGTPSVSRYTGRRWHTDLSQTLAPSTGSLLRCWRAPEIGGDTLFANMYAAYDARSPGMQKLIADLHAVHYAGDRKLDNTNADRAHADEQRRISPPVAHPVVRVHPETGRRAIYLGEKVKRFDGMTEEESRPLIDWLNRHATRSEFVYRHQWRPNDIVLWDNRCTMHQALGDYDPSQSRYMERSTIVGTPLGYTVS
ncbi:MAG TPA: TauD/TfdA family dioxygenase [Burkholderiales bacterium]|nr:TauD/TfdA family dioxygenase [Burkholderiales bacterium]